MKKMKGKGKRDVAVSYFPKVLFGCLKCKLKKCGDEISYWKRITAMGLSPMVCL